MDFSESTKLVFQRIKELDPANAIKIIGYLLLEGYDEHGMIRLAYSPDNVIQSLIDKTKQELALFPKTTISVNGKAPQAKNSFGTTLPSKFTPFTPASSRFPLSCPDKGQVGPQFHLEQPLIHNSQHVPMPYFDSSSGGYGFHNQPHFVPLEDPMAKNYNPRFPWHPNPNQIYWNYPEISTKLCEHFSQGYCRYGASCKFLHVLHMENGNVMVLNSPNANEDHVGIGSLGFIQQLEMELIELLRPRRGVPVTITSLPVLYYEKYGKMLQAEGYNLTHLLAQMSKNIRLIDRPHGQECVILGEHIPMYMRFVEERKERETSFTSLCQVYLTFPPHSILSEKDVHNYFNNFGPVHDVRIPKQEKRMFAFVTFLYPETVTLVLKTGNPHFISDARVLVKPYRDKPTLIDRKSEENVHLPMCSSSSSPGAEYKLLTKAKSCDHVCFPAKQQLVIEELEQAVDGSSLQQEVVSNGCITEDNIGLIKTCSTDEKSFGEINLPDSPFACDVATYGISLDSSEPKKDLEL